MLTSCAPGISRNLSRSAPSPFLSFSLSSPAMPHLRGPRPAMAVAVEEEDPRWWRSVHALRVHRGAAAGQRRAAGGEIDASQPSTAMGHHVAGEGEDGSTRPPHSWC